MKIFNYVVAMFLWVTALLAAPSGHEEGYSELLEVESLQGSCGHFRGFTWQKEGDVFYIAPTHPSNVRLPGNLRINNHFGTVIMNDIKLEGDLIVDARRIEYFGLITYYNCVLLPFEEIVRHGLIAGHMLSRGVSERSVALDEDFIPHNGHTLIAGTCQ